MPSRGKSQIWWSWGAPGRKEADALAHTRRWWSWAEFVNPSVIICVYTIGRVLAGTDLSFWENGICMWGSVCVWRIRSVCEMMWTSCWTFELVLWEGELFRLFAYRYTVTIGLFSHEWWKFPKRVSQWEPFNWRWNYIWLIHQSVVKVVIMEKTNFPIAQTMSWE